MGAGSGKAKADIIEKMARGKCVVCEKKNVDISLPSGLVCTYCDAHFHSECSPTFAKIDSEVLVVVKKVCAPCPNCENGLVFAVYGR